MSVRSVSNGNSLGLAASAVAGCWANIGSGDWCIGLWVRRDVLNPTGVLFSVAGGAPASFSAMMTANENMILWDGGSTSATDLYRMYFGAKDSAGTQLSAQRSIVTNGATFPTLPIDGYERIGNTRELMVVQRRAGVTQVWRCRVGQRAQLVVSESGRTFGGFTDNRPVSFLRARFGTAQAFTSMIDRPFHIAGRSLTQLQIEQITHGVRANDVDKTGIASGTIQFASVTTGGTNPADTFVRANPVAGTTLTLNGVVITFVASGAAGDQVNIGAALSDTVTNLLAYLNGSANALLTVATYSSFTIDGVVAGIRITHKTAGTIGEAYTIASSSANTRFGSAGKLAYCEWEFGALSATTIPYSVSGSAYLNRASNVAWPAAAADLAEPLNANYVLTDSYSPGTVFQIDEGASTATFAVSGVYGGAVPSAIQCTAVDLSNGTPIAAAANVANLVASAGTWSGTVTLAKGLRWLGWRLNAAGFSAVSAETPFGVGVVVGISGQSLAAILTKFPAVTAPDASNINSTVSTGYASRFLPLTLAANNDVVSGLSGWYLDNNWHRMTAADCGGSGEAAFGNALSAAAGCVVGMFNRAIGGTGIDTFISGAPSWATDLAASKTNRISKFLWTHGTANAGTTDYITKLGTLDGLMRTAIGAGLDFGMIVQDNNTFSNDGTDGIHIIRAQHVKWIRDKAAAAPKLYHELMDNHDLLVQFVADIGDGVSGAPVNTPYDGVHPKRGEQASRKGERMAAAVAYRMGFRATSTQGPKIKRAVRTGAVIDVMIAQAAGTTLVTGSVSSISTTTGGPPAGFDVSANGFTSLLAITSTAIINANTVRITLAADPGQEVDVLYLYGRPGKKTSLEPTGRSSVTVDLNTVQDNMLYDGQAGFTYSPNGLLVSPLTVPMRTVPPSHKAKIRTADQTVILSRGPCGISSDGRLQLVV